MLSKSTGELIMILYCLIWVTPMVMFFVTGFVLNWIEFRKQHQEDTERRSKLCCTVKK